MFSANKVHKNLWIGSAVDTYNPDILRANDINVLFCVAKELVKPNWMDDAWKYNHIELIDSSDENLDIHLSETVSLIDKYIQEGNNVLVYCSMGISRSTSIICAYLMSIHKTTFSYAFRHIYSVRSIVNPNLGFILALEDINVIKMLHSLPITMCDCDKLITTLAEEPPTPPPSPVNL
jgi:protein-tyrosine phosphatase